MEIGVHDIVRIKTADCIQFDGEKPDWAVGGLVKNAYGIVRRAPIVNNRIPIGIRGAHRHERASGHLHISNVIERITPEDVTERIHLFKRKSMISDSLLQIQHIMKRHALQWGLIGSIAYEIATNAEVVKDSSDIDIIIRTSLNASSCKRLMQQIKALPIRIDISIEKEAGSYSLIEFVESQESKVLLKTAFGPRLVEKSVLEAM